MPRIAQPASDVTLEDALDAAIVRTAGVSSAEASLRSIIIVDDVLRRVGAAPHNDDSAAALDGPPEAAPAGMRLLAVGRVTTGGPVELAVAPAAPAAPDAPDAVDDAQPLPWEAAGQTEGMTALLLPLTPYEMGFCDAVDGEPCLPEIYFVRREQKIAYAEGYENAGLPTPLSRWTLEKETR